MKFLPQRFSRYLYIYNIVALLLLFTITSFFFIQKAHAQTTGGNEFLKPNVDSNVDRNLNTFTQSVIIETLSGAVCILTGVDPVNKESKCLGVDRTTGKLGYTNQGKGMVGAMTDLIGMTFIIPVSSSQYTSYLASNFGITKSAYAANDTSTGFTGLKPVLKLWETFRNLMYLVFVVLFVVIGLGIMFRVKIDARTVMSIQNQIPKIVIALILITLSYAIAGFLIDLMYISIYLMVNILKQADSNIGNIGVEVLRATNPIGGANTALTGPDGGGIFHLGKGGIIGIAWEIGGHAGSILSGLVDNPIGRIVMGIAGGVIGKFIQEAPGTSQLFSIGGMILGGVTGGFLGPQGAFVGTTVGKFLGDYAGAIIGGAAGGFFASDLANLLGQLVTFLIITIALLWALFRLWFQLIKAYIFILMDVVFAPIWIGIGILPGEHKLSFTGWLRHIGANLLAFPATITILLLGRIFIDGFQGTTGSGQFVPPLIANGNLLNSVASIIGIGIILTAPEVTTRTRAILNAPDIKIPPSIVQSLAVGARTITSPTKGTFNIVGSVWKAKDEPVVNQAGGLERRGITRALTQRIFK